MARGGYRKPNKPSAVSGPGKFAKRTDGQPVRSPDLDTPGQKFGDRQMIEAGQRAAPIAGASGASVPRRNQHSVPTGKELPPWFFDQESQHPLEPVTAGVDMGAGPGSEVLAASEPPDDEVELVLEYLATTFQNATAAKHLAEYRNERAGNVAAPPALPAAPTVPSQPVV
jgi:hypothetical protein